VVEKQTPLLLHTEARSRKYTRAMSTTGLGVLLGVADVYTQENNKERNTNTLFELSFVPEIFIEQPLSRSSRGT